MVSCAVASCKNTSVKITKHTNGITFHRFPRDKKRRRQWEVAVDRENWSSTASSAVCSEHFDVKDFYVTDSGLRRLSVEAVPVINISICQPRAQTVTDLQPADINSTDSEEVVKLKYKLRRLEIISSNRKRRIYELWKSNKRFKKKLQQMKTVIKHLIQNKEESEKLCTEQNNGLESIHIDHEGIGYAEC
ncbi:THAP domain-containing protein 2-like [Leguminivora glycinivorella]|uniref:THAP domain-containing protein 2-like n=1 Tax=Leguminivora glycinivorella TaxID=1035111 RepID=UPI00200F82A9|nr:THAP domain-containing protein 2-like [Leguminivora glycinivorella]XP_047986770.1 THAP domain-containing protein 2-like [Leguminivora glycinivorella]